MTFQERNAEGPPVGEPLRVGRVLSEEEVASITEITAEELDCSAGRQQVLDLCASHRLLAERNKELEAVLKETGRLAQEVKQELAGLKELWGRV
ncbi:hypothetical protein LCGC14_1364180 [marine sediment metagenome]|uniref:Uncharacterized protein n=1 Tax=marine sediment metagenome TaxID=412755 RepID=A0A0F9N9D1_9ZZZZ